MHILRYASLRTSFKGGDVVSIHEKLFGLLFYKIIKLV